MAFDPQTQLANIVVVANETARMTETFRTWPERYWRRPTYCPDWRAVDAVAHLATGGDFYAQVIASGRPFNVPGIPSSTASPRGHGTEPMGPQVLALADMRLA